jgi:hypothetical protein
MKSVVAAIILWSVIGFSPEASGDLLIDELHYTVSLGAPAVQPAAYFSLAYAFDDADLFEDVEVTSAADGSSFIANAETDGDFIAFAGHLTNGQEERLFLWHFSSPGRNGNGFGGSDIESGWFKHGHPDFGGSHMSKIVMDVDWTPSSERVSMTLRFGFYAVPEPTSLATVAMACGGAAVFRRKKAA